ncbi:facilitated trehalose transporter Tret1-like [Periplaneta americana]|uniref:facilitated trehalose transporter Tret1-like n=1 Tax=Periplaneta americana TaxID=6978 RepID=UPI0037E7C396
MARARGVLDRICSLLPHSLAQYVTAIAASMSFLLVGTISSWSSATLLRIIRDEFPVPLSVYQASWMVMLVGIGGLVSAVPAGIFVNLVGRKTVLMFTAVPVIVSWLLIMYTRSLSMLFVARVLSGFGVSIVFVACPMYIGEIAEAKIRGSVGCLMHLFVSIGRMLGYAVGNYISFTTLALVASILTVIFLIMMAFVSDSPYFLLTKGERSKAEVALARLRSKTIQEVQVELDGMQKIVAEQMSNGNSLRDLVTFRGALRALVVMIGLIILQEFCGIVIALRQTREVFVHIPGSNLTSSESVVVVECIGVLVNIATICLVDRLGRRPLLLASAFGCATSLTILGIFQFLHIRLQVDMSSYHWVAIGCLVAFVIFYNLGIGTLNMVIMGEIFPINIKGFAMSVGALLLWSCYLTMSNLYHFILIKLGIYTAFWLISAVSISGIVFILFLVPEGKGKPLGRIVTGTVNDIETRVP